jgi:hypothetical protein
LVLKALAGGPFAPAAEAPGLEGFSHVVDDLAFSQAGDFADFLEGDAIGPGGSNNPVGTDPGIA